MAADAQFFAEYAKSARSKCKLKSCPTRVIEKDTLRIGKRYTSDRFTEGGFVTDWYHPACIFDTFKRARATSKKIESEDDIVGFEFLQDTEKALLRSLIAESASGKSSEAKPAKPKPSKPKTAKPKTAITSTSPAKPRSFRVFLLRPAADGRPIGPLSDGTTDLGRGPLTGITDKRCSRHQVQITIDSSAKQVVAVARGSNPSFLTRKGGDPEQMEKDRKYELFDEDCITLLCDKYPLTLQIEGGDADTTDMSPLPAAPTSKKRKHDYLKTSGEKELEAFFAPKKKQKTMPRSELPLSPHGTPPGSPVAAITHSASAKPAAMDEVDEDADDALYRSVTTRGKPPGTASVKPKPAPTRAIYESPPPSPPPASPTRPPEVRSPAAKHVPPKAPPAATKDGVSRRSEDEEEEKQEEEEKTDNRPVCAYGRACYRKNPTHFREFAHPWLKKGGGGGGSYHSNKGGGGHHYGDRPSKAKAAANIEKYQRLVDLAGGPMSLEGDSDDVDTRKKGRTEEAVEDDDVRMEGVDDAAASRDDVSTPGDGGRDPASYGPVIAEISKMFKNIDKRVVAAVVEANKGNKQKSVNALLEMA